ncbi:hypothetical protein GDO81_027495, partial [Engystomops pustulosus]
WTFPSRITALLGSCVEIPCTYHPAGTSDTSGTVWYLYRSLGTDPKIFNNKDSSSVMEKYRDRTSLVRGDKSCTLRIDPVRRGDEGKYYPGNRKINAYKKHSKTVILTVTDSPGNIELNGTQTIKEGEATTMQCFVDHTCRSSPPSIQWNKPGQIKVPSEEISAANWREKSELTYFPTLVDDGATVQCTATYHKGQQTQRSITLDIKYAPKNVTITITGKAEFREGSDVTLQCNSVSRPDVSEYEWYKGETRLPDRGREMTVRSVTRDMEPYSCAARNTVGRGESAPIHIPVIYAAAGVHITVRNDHEMVCDFRSSRPDVTHYTWRKDGSILHNETGKTLTIDNNGHNNGRYSCIAHNRVGNSSSE